MSAPVDLVARRAACTRDARSCVDDIVAGAESLHATASGLPLQPVSEARIVGLERHLVALGVLVANLRQHVPPTSGAA